MSVAIHPQAAPFVCRHALDTLISLAKMFPTYFLPRAKDKAEGDDKPAAAGGSPKPQRAADARAPDNDLWSILVRLDSASGKSKGKGELCNIVYHI